MNVENKVISKHKNARLIRTTALTFVCFVLGILIAMQYKNIREMKAKDELSYNTIYEYQRELIKMQEEIDTLSKEKAELQTKVEMFEKGIPTQQVEHLQNELKNVKTFAGLTKVTGAGLEIEIELSNPSDLPTAGSLILLLLNELKSSSAQAISVNGVRLVSMSDVRVVGNALTIDGQVYGQPIYISAIGEPISMNSAITMRDGVRDQFYRVFGLDVSFSITQKQITMDAYDITKLDKKINLLSLLTE